MHHRGRSINTTAEPLMKIQRAVKVHRYHLLCVLWAFYCKWLNYDDFVIRLLQCKQQRKQMNSFSIR